MKEYISQKVAMINVPTKMGRIRWATCFVLTARRSSVFGINETLTKSAKNVYLRLAKIRGFEQYGINQGPNPIFWKKKDWKFVAGKHVHLHGKGPNYRADPGFNDDRYMTIVVLQKRGRNGQPVGPEQAFINTHWVASNRSKVPESWVEARRKESIDYARDIIQLGLNKGMVVWFFGDTNVAGGINFGKDFRWIKALGIDKIGVGIPEGISLRHARFDQYRAPTDHKNGVVATAIVAVK